MIGASLETARRALAYIAPDERDTWVRMGMALKSEFGDAAYDAWEEWSSVASNFDVKACKASWKSFKSGGKVGIGTLFSEAKPLGFVFDQSELEVSPEELAKRQRERKERDAKAEIERLERAKAASKRAGVQWRIAARDGDSPYLIRKKVDAESCRYIADGGLIVPFYRYDFEPPSIVGKQAIFADGSKKNSGGMDKHGAACCLGNAPVDGDDIGICEGYATGLSVRMATGRRFAVYMAIDAGNMPHAAQILRKKYPKSRIIFFADDDYLTGGAGYAKATAAANSIGNAIVVLPSFSVPRRASKKDESLPCLTDFNDLHVAESLEAVTAQIEAALANAAITSEASLDSIDQDISPVPPWIEGDDVLSPVPSEAESATANPMANTAADAAVQGGGGKKSKSRKEYGKEHWDAVQHLLDHFVLIYGDDTCWDDVNRMILKVNHLRLAYGSDAVKFWLNNPCRRMVNKENVVFDPTMRADPDANVNLFDGFKVVPKKGACNKIVDLLAHLCDDNEEVMTWVISWLAYPLQYPGAKMRTSIIIHGDEGSGKNLFFEDCVQKIYGEYGAVIGNAQIESAFNEWASRKLFMVADEVVTRTELRQLKGKIKHMVTGGSIRINPKGLSERDEANHMNFVFLSNELQPLALDKTDRRYQVIWTPPKKEEAFYREVAEQIYDGGIEAFYDFLLNFPLGDFNEHTKPLMSEAKKNLISLGLAPAERFYREWSGGFLPLPFVCCSAMQLYQAFCRWSHLNGERFPATQTMFGRTIGRVAFGEVRSAPVKYPMGEEIKQRTVYLVGKQPDDKDRATWAADGSELFEGYLRKYRNVYEPENE